MRQAGTGILVTGASGLLGAYLVREVGEDGTFAGLANVPPDDPRWVACDLRDSDATAALVADRRPATIVNAAALTNVDLCEREPELARAVNRDTAGNLASAAAESGARLVHISTDSVFDGSRGGWTEDDATAPLNEYARSKLAAEQVVADAGGDHLVLRTNFFGRGGGLAKWLVGELRAGKEVTGFGDVVFSPLHASTLARLVLELARGNVQGVLHLGARDAVSKLDFARRVARAYGCDDGLVRAGLLADVELDAPRSLDTSLDTSRAARLLGRDLPSVDEEIARMVELEP